MKLRQRPVRRSTSETMQAPPIDEDPTENMPNIATIGHREPYAATVVSPCKRSPKYMVAPKSAHQNAANAAANDLQNKRTTNTNGMILEEDNVHFGILDMAGGVESVNKASAADMPSHVMHAAALSTENMVANEGRDSAMSTSSAFRHPSELMIFPEVRVSQDCNMSINTLSFKASEFDPIVPRTYQPCFLNNQEVTVANPLENQPTQGLLELDYSNLDFLGDKGSFDSSKDCDQGTPCRRRHSLDLSSPNDYNYKLFKQSHSLPHEQIYLNNAPIASFGSNSSGLTPIPVGGGVNPRAQNDAVPIKPNSSPMPLIAPPQIGVSMTFKPHSKVFLNPKASKNGVNAGGNTGAKRHLCFAKSYPDIKRPKLTMPPQLVPDDKEGRNLVVIRGSSKQCTDVRSDVNEAAATKKRETLVVTPHTKTSHFGFLKSMYTALDGLTFLLPGLKMRVSPNKPFSYPDLNIRVSSHGSFKLGHDRFPDNVSDY